MAKTVSLSPNQSTGSKSLWRKGLSRLLSLMFGTHWGRRATAALVVVLVTFLGRSYLMEEVYPPVSDAVLTAVGYGFYPITAWLLLALLAGRFRLNWFVSQWRWWLSVVLLIAAAQTVMGSVHGSLGIVAIETLGGKLGQLLWGASALQGVAVATILVVAAVAVPKPGPVLRYGKLAVVLLGKAFLWMGYLLLKGLVKGLGGGRGLVVVLASIRRNRAKAIETIEPSDADTDLFEERRRRRILDHHPPIESLYPEDDAFVAGDRGETDIEREATGRDHWQEDTALVVGEDTPRNLQTLPPAGLSPSTNVGAWMLPPMPLLDYGPKVEVDANESNNTADRIEETLRSHNIKVEVIEIKPGPTVTLYGLSPGWVEKTREVKDRDDEGNLLRDEQGKPIVKRVKERTRVRVDSIVAREKDLALTLAAPSLRIQAPVPGEAIVGIEVPNAHPVLVSLRTVLESHQVNEINETQGLALALGQGSGGDPVVTNLRKLPHLLIAGATGSGKSVCLNTIIVSLISQVPPEKLRMLLIDPKRIELTPFNGLPHLVTPVVVDAEHAVNALKGMLREMFRRYKLMEELGVRNIDVYHAHPGAAEPLPYLVIAVDELADLMMSDTYNVERTLTRLAQLGRATGIHLIVATQRPSVDVVTGLIKANFPSRISFAVVSQVDSRTILDAVGAERLLGKGDMLFLSSDTPKPQRVQGAYLSDREIERIMEFWRNQTGPPLPEIRLDAEPEQDQEDRGGGHGGGSSSGSNSDDDLLNQAVELAGRHRSISTSLLQRRLRIGYPRAARLMDQLEDEGIIGPGEQGKPREVYVFRE